MSRRTACASAAAGHLVGVTVFMAWTSADLRQIDASGDLAGPWREVIIAADGLAFVDSDDTLSKVFHALKWSLPTDVAVAVATEIVQERIDGEAVVELSRQSIRPPFSHISLFDLILAAQVPPIGLLFRRTAIGAVGGFDESLSVDNVLFRQRLQDCLAVANAVPAKSPSLLSPGNPAAYKPKTEFDNTPWRFDMSQNGKRMTAEEFDAWMKARGVRVVKARPAPDAATTAEAAPAAQPATETK